MHIKNINMKRSLQSTEITNFHFKDYLNFNLFLKRENLKKFIFHSTENPPPSNRFYRKNEKKYVTHKNTFWRFFFLSNKRRENKMNKKQQKFYDRNQFQSFFSVAVVTLSKIMYI